MDIQKIGSFISNCRKEKGITQEELAERLGVTNRSVSRWENGKTMPDVSLYENICRELNITVAELFAAQRATPQNQGIIIDYSMDQILKEYGRMKKQRRVLGIISLILGVIVLIRLVLPVFVVSGILAIEAVIPFKTVHGEANYDKDFYLEKYGGDLGSTLMIFPDSLGDKEVKTFKSSLKTGLFDTDGYILLVCTMDEAEMAEEIQRLSSIEATIRFQDETYTNYVMYDEESYPYPAYITCDGHDSTYEYALIDEEGGRIIYLYISVPNVANPNYMMYLKKNPLAYANSSLEDYTLYYHTFDGGQTWIGYQE